MELHNKPRSIISQDDDPGPLIYNLKLSKLSWKGLVGIAHDTELEVQIRGPIARTQCVNRIPL